MIRPVRRRVLLAAAAAPFGPVGATRAAVAVLEPRSRMSRMFTGALRIWDLPPGGPVTYLMVVPLEAHCTAVRLGFASNLSGQPWTVRSAAIHPSDSYGLAVGMALDAQAAGQGHVWPVTATGAGQAARVFFDNGGADLARVNLAGSRRSLTLAPVADNAGDKPRGYAIAWSDFVPVASIPRADGGAHPLLFITVTLDGPRMAGAFFNAQAWTRNPLNRARMICTGRAAVGTDLADDPAQASFKADPGCPVIAIQYVSRVPGATVVTTGDSLVTAPDGFSNALVRAAMDLSSPELPIEVANMAWGGTNYAVYGDILSRNLAAIEPAVLAFQPLSRNDGATMPRMQGLLAHAVETAETARTRFGTAPMWFSPGCEATFYGTNAASLAAQAAFADMRQRLAESAVRDRIPLIDGPGVIGRRDLPYVYGSANVWLAADVPAGATELPILDASQVPRAFPGDRIWSLSHPGALRAGTTVVAASATSIELAAGAVAVGFARGERLAVGPAGLEGRGGWTDDNIHPNDAGVEALVPAARAALAEALRPMRR